MDVRKYLDENFCNFNIGELNTNQYNSLVYLLSKFHIDIVEGGKNETIDSLNKSLISRFRQMCHATEYQYAMEAAKFFAWIVDSWKNEEDNDEQIADLKSKVCQATTFLSGLKDTPDSATIGDLRSFIDANYDNIVK